MAQNEVTPFGTGDETRNFRLADPACLRTSKIDEPREITSPESPLRGDTSGNPSSAPITQASVAAEEHREERRERRRQKREKRRRKRKGRKRQLESATTAAESAQLPEATSDQHRKQKKEHRRGRPAESASDARPRGKHQADSPALKIALLAPEATRIILSSSIEEAFRNVGNEIVIDSGASGADLTIDAAQADAPQIAESKDSRLRIVLEPLPRRGEDVAQANLRRRAAAMRARAAGAIFVRPASNLRRLGKYPELVEAGALDPEQSKVIADAVRSIIVSRLIPSHANTAILSNEAADYVEAAALVTSSSDLLAKISWESKRLPRTLYVPFKAEIIEAFLDSKIAFFARKSLETVPLGSPIDWRQRLPNASARSALFGLEFLSAVLTFWYQKASGAKSKSVSAVETMLKQRAVTASALLSQVGEIISDFTAHNPPRTPLTAWQGRTVKIGRASCRERV